jgi:hypothetical protein
MAAGAPGRVATGVLADRPRSNDQAKRNMPVLDFAKADDFDAMREKLTSEEAKAVLDRYKKQQLNGTKYFTDKDMDALRRYCEAEGNHIIYSREVALLRDAGEPIPGWITRKLAEGETVQAYGSGGMEKLSREAAQTEANALGLNKSSRARIVEEVRQTDWLDGINPEELDDHELDAALAETASNILKFAGAKSK